MRLAFTIRAGLTWALLAMAGAASAALDDGPTTADDSRPAAKTGQRQKLAALVETRKGQKARAAGPEAIFKRLADDQETVSRVQFETAIKKHLPRLAERPQAIGRLFDRLDANSDGALTQEEFQKVRALADRLSDRAVKPGQDEHKDKGKAKKNKGEGKGKKNKGEGKGRKRTARLETRKGQKARAAGPEAIFKRMADGQETVSREQFETAIKQRMPRLAERPQVIGRLFDRLDANGDGALNTREFQKRVGKWRRG